MKIKNYMTSVKTWFVTVCCLTFMLSTGCEDFLKEKEIPRITADFYASKQGITSAVAATYSYMRTGVNTETVNIFTELGTDLITGAEGALAYPTNRYDGALKSDYSNFYTFWDNHYKAIGVANLVLASLPDIGDITNNEKLLCQAEISFLRAFFYFDLLKQFGSIPLITEAIYEPRTDFKRASLPDIYRQIIADLRFAEEYLRETASKQGEATRYAAAHLLAKVYLTRCSAVADQRGQLATDADSALYYARKVIESPNYGLLNNFADLWSMDNMGNREVIFSVQFTTDPIYNGSTDNNVSVGGNKSHLYWGSFYEDQNGMMRDIENGRPYRFFRATNRTMFDLFDRKNDSRFYKSFKWVYYCNRAVTTGTRPLAPGDTAIYYSLNPERTDRTYAYTYFQWDKDNPGQNNRYYPPLLKYFDPKRAAMNNQGGSREWVRMRLAETYLIAAEAAGRAGDYNTAAEYVNVVRKRAAWADGETKMPQYWVEEGGDPNNTQSTYDEIKVTANDISANFVDFMLDERGRELLGEYQRWEDLVRCEKLVERVQLYNPDAKDNVKGHHKLRPIPQNHIDRLNPKGSLEEEQNEGYY